MILIANGCSHTAGAEIEYSGQNKCYEKAWPFLLSKKLECEHVNLSTSGASCDRVVRTTLKHLHIAKMSNNYDPSNLFFIIMWPGIWRTEMFQIYPNEPGFFDGGWMPMVVGNDNNYQKQASELGYMNFKSWVSRSTEVSESINFYKNMLFLQNLFHVNKIKYLFLNAVVTLPSPKMKAFTDEVYIKRYFGFNNTDLCYANILEEKGFRWGPNSAYAHYGEDAHEWFADFLKSYITKNNLL